MNGNTPDQNPSNQPNPTPQANQPPTGQPGKGYGKKPVWFWVLLYVVVGGLLYFLIYYLFLRGDNGGGLY